MSQFLTVKTKIKDREVLKRVIIEMGYPFEEGKNLHLYGYTGDLRPQTADIVIRRQHIGKGSNDLGFKRVGEFYDMIISEYDQRAGRQKFDDLQAKAVRLQEEIERELKRQYAIQKVKEETKKLGFSVVEETHGEGGIVRILLRRFR